MWLMNRCLLLVVQLTLAFAVLEAAPKLSGFTDCAIVNEEGTIVFAPKIIVTGGESYSGGSLKVSWEDPIISEYFTFVSDAAINVKNAFSYENQQLYLGTGENSREQIGYVDAVDAGQYGGSLKVHFLETAVLDDALVQIVLRHMAVSRHYYAAFPSPPAQVTVELQDEFGNVGNISSYLQVTTTTGSVSGKIFPGITLMEDSGAYVIESLTAFFDIALEEVETINVAAGSDIVQLSTYKKDTLLILPKKDQFGDVEVMVSISLGCNEYTKTFTCTVVSVNDKLRIEPIPDVSHEKSASAISNSIEAGYYDDDTAVTFAVESSNTQLLPAENLSLSQLEGNKVRITYETAAGESGVSVIKVSITDKEGVVFSEHFKVSVREGNDKHCVRDLKNALTFERIAGANSGAEHVTQALDLSDDFTWVCDAALSWKSSETDLLSDNGTVTPSSTQRVAAIEATITKAGISERKALLIRIPAAVTNDAQALEQAVSDLTFETIRGENRSENSILQQLDLIGMGSNETIVSWHSSNEEAINPYSGVVTPAQEAQSVTLTAKFWRGDTMSEKSFHLTVPPMQLQSAAKLEADLATLTLDTLLRGNHDAQHVRFDMVRLPLKGANGSMISWSSDHPSIITSEGEVIRDEVQDVSVRLTATLEEAQETRTKQFDLKVLKPLSDAVVDADKGFLRLEESLGTYRLQTVERNTELTLEQSADQTEFVDDALKVLSHFSDRLLKLFLNTDGSFEVKSEVDTMTTQINMHSAGATAVSDQSGAVTLSYENEAGKTVTAWMKADDSTGYSVGNTSVTSVPGGTQIDAGAAGISLEYGIENGGERIVAAVTTKLSGESEARFIVMNISTGDEVSSDRVHPGVLIEGSEVILSRGLYTMSYEITTDLNDTIVIE